MKKYLCLVSQENGKFFYLLNDYFAFYLYVSVFVMLHLLRVPIFIDFWNKCLCTLVVRCKYKVVLFYY